MRLVGRNARLLALVFLAGCASLRPTSSDRLDQQVMRAEIAYRHLDASHVAPYNDALTAIARHINGETPDEVRAQLGPLGVTLDEPKITLRLARYHMAPASSAANDPTTVGAAMLLEYDTSNSPLYPGDGLMVAASAIYRRVEGKPHLSLLTGGSKIKLDGSTYRGNLDKVAPITAMSRRGRHLARSGFRYMLSQSTMRERPGIYLTEPYDPNRMILLMLPGLQSTPFALADLIKAVRREPQLSEHCQVWTFLYGTGTPVLFNALELRQDLGQTIRMVDPRDHDFATRHIMVLGHSMGGLLAHTLVSSSGERLWKALFTVPSQQLRGDPATIRRFSEALHFRRNPRVLGAIFAATPHRGSRMAESWIGHLGASLIRLPSELQTDIVDVLSRNRDARTVAADAFDREMNFTAIHTLSPRDPALNTLAELPIAVPFHSVIGQLHRGPVETSSDGVVPYDSSHLDGAKSELVVRSGHNVCQNPDAQREVIRILRTELEREQRVEGKAPNDESRTRPCH